MRTASFLVGEDGHEDSEEQERAIAEDGHKRERFGLGETATINLQAQSVCANDGDEEPGDDRGDDGGPHAKLPAHEQQDANGDFGEWQRVRDELRCVAGNHLVGINLHGEQREGHRHIYVRRQPRAKKFGIAGVNEDCGEDDASQPDDDAAKIERRGLDHFVTVVATITVCCSRFNTAVYWARS